MKERYRIIWVIEKGEIVWHYFKAMNDEAYISNRTDCMLRMLVAFTPKRK